MSRQQEYDSVASCPWTTLDSRGAVGSPDETIILRMAPMYRKTPRTGPRWKSDTHFHEMLKVKREGDAVAKAIGDSGPEEDSIFKAVGGSPIDGAPATGGRGAEKEVSDETRSKVQESSTENNPCSILLTWKAQSREGIAIALSPQPKYTGGKTYEVFYGDRSNTNTLIEKGCGREKVKVSLPGRHCSEKEWMTYWIALHQGKVYVGVGEEPPEQCLGVLEDPSATISSTWYAGMGNSSMKRADERAFHNRYKMVRLAPLKLSLAQALQAIDTTHIAVINVGDVDTETKALQAEYEEECRKARNRAEKFGIPYKEPPKFLPQNKRRVHSSTGLATGVDLQDPEEQAKQKERRERFGIADVLLEYDGVGSKDIVPVTQAWDNEELVSAQRADPPNKLWKSVPVETDIGSVAPAFEESFVVPEKIHLFAIDWAAFLQIRTNDLSAHFSLYSPTHVEWLGDLSCNIHFADRFSAARALRNLSQEIPTPPPPEVIPDGNSAHVPDDLGAMGWRLGKTMLRKVADDRFGRKGTTARVLLRVATSQDTLRGSSSKRTKTPPGFSKTRVLGPGSDLPDKKTNKRKRSKRENATDIRSEEPSLLNRSLKASRSGFTVEEMVTERARKRARTAGGIADANEKTEVSEE